MMRQPEPLIKGCSPADFDIGSDRGWRDASNIYLINIKSFLAVVPMGMWAKASISPLSE